VALKEEDVSLEVASVNDIYFRVKHVNKNIRIYLEIMIGNLG
jgi:hypothetical protein